MMWNKHQSQQQMDVEVDVQVIGEPTDFVYVGSAETEEDTEETQPERPDSKTNPSGDLEEDDEDYEHDSPETWFPLTRHPWGIQYARIPRNGHSPYTKSWRYFAAKRIEID